MECLNHKTRKNNGTSKELQRSTIKNAAKKDTIQKEGVLNH